MNDRSFTIESFGYTTTRLVRRDGVKVAILFPPEGEGAPFQLYPHPDTFPGLGFAGLPAPLRPEFMPFASLAEVETFLGIGRPAAAAPRKRALRRAATPEKLAA
ncbi:hypothetical protein [Methylobacterium sp. A54F]